MNEKLFSIRIIVTTVCFFLAFFGIFLFFACAFIDVMGGPNMGSSSFIKGCVAVGLLLPFFCTVVICIAMPPVSDMLEWDSNHKNDSDK